MNIRPHQALLNILKNAHDEVVPRYAILLGAGCSVTSGVALASSMESHFKRMLFDCQNEYDTFEKFVSARPWHKEGQSDYGSLFEQALDLPPQRRDYLLRCFKGAIPYWGYWYLANLLKANRINVVLTTNFDDLVEQACNTLGLKADVYSHEASIKGFKFTSLKPSVIKLHGDFLHGNLCNTHTETSRLQDPVGSKVDQLAADFGLIVIGYSGRDFSVMDAIERNLQDDQAFGYGVYWCVTDEKAVVPRVQEFAEKYARFKLIKIDGFDEIMSLVHETYGLELPSDRFDQVTIVQNHFAGLLRRPIVSPDGAASLTSVIQQDQARMLRAVERVAGPPSSQMMLPSVEGEYDVLSLNTLPSRAANAQLLAAVEEKLMRPLKAAVYMFEAFQGTGEYRFLCEAFDLQARGGGDLPIDFLQRAVNVGSTVTGAFMLTPCILSCLNAGWYHEADALLQLIERACLDPLVSELDRSVCLINRSQWYLHRGLPVPEDSRALLSNVAEGSNVKMRAGALIALERFEEAANQVIAAIQLGEMSIDDLSWPLFRLMEGKLGDHPLEALLDSAGPSRLYPYARRSKGRSNARLFENREGGS
jgi:NAD-dependent SIR2 family protein deacetylase